jgi:hypothetical protein
MSPSQRTRATSSVLGDAINAPLVNLVSTGSLKQFRPGAPEPAAPRSSLIPLSIEIAFGYALGMADSRRAIREAAAIMGRKGGKIGGLSRSPAKLATARANGKLGGRPVGSRNKKTAAK